MKKMIALWGLLLYAVPSGACDVCGSAGASGAFSPGGFFPENQFSLNYQYLSFRSRHLPSMLKGQEGVERVSREQFHLLQAGGRWSFAKRWQAIAALPYQHVVKYDAGKTTQLGGLADIQLGFAHYRSWDSLPGNAHVQAVAEYSMELPTGKFNSGRINEDVSRYMLPGSGSVDHLTRLGLQVERKTWRLLLGGLFRLNGRGPDGLDWGNRWQLQAGIGKDLRVGEKHKMLLSIAYLEEGGGADYQDKNELPFSAYRLGMLQGAVAWRYKNMAVGASYFQSVHGMLGDGRVDMRARCQVQWIYYLGGEK